MNWMKSSYRGEYTCEHGIGHGNHVHGCDGCCSRGDYPLKGILTWEGFREMSEKDRFDLLVKTTTNLRDLTRWMAETLSRNPACKRTQENTDGT